MLLKILNFVSDFTSAEQSRAINNATRSKAENCLQREQPTAASSGHKVSAWEALLLPCTLGVGLLFSQSGLSFPSLTGITFRPIKAGTSMNMCVCSTDITKADCQEVKRDLLSPRILPLMWLGNSEKLIKFLVIRQNLY